MIKRRTFIATATATAWAALPVVAKDDPMFRVRALAEQAQRDLAAPGLVYGVVRGGGMVSKGALGVLRQGGAAATDQTVFRAAAAYRPLLAMAIASHVEQGRLSFDQPIADLLPGLRVGDPRFVGATVDHLLTHRSGLPDDVPPGAGSSPVKLDLGVDLSGVWLQFVPGDGFAPSRLGLLLLTAVIETLDAAPFAAAMRGGLFSRLDLRRSTFGIDTVDPTGLAAPHVADGVGVTRPRADLLIAPDRFAVGDLFSCTDDLLGLVQTHLSEGRSGRRGMVSSAMVRTLTAPLSVKIGVPGYPAGLQVARGWFVLPRAGRRILAHGSGGGGYSSLCLFCPEGRFGLVVLANAQTKPRSDPLRSFALTAIDEGLFDVGRGPNGQAH